MIPDLDTWFEQEVLPHERSLVRYITRVWPNGSEIQDIVQDVCKVAQQVRAVEERCNFKGRRYMRR